MARQIELIPAGGEKPHSASSFLYHEEEDSPSRNRASLFSLGSVFLLGFIISAVGLLSVGISPTYRVPSVSYSTVANTLSSFLSDHKVELSEPLMPFSEMVYEKLPWQKSNLQWIFSLSEMEQSLQQIPLLIAPTVRRCSFFSFRCFTIDAGIRSPRMYAKLESEWWFVDSKGRFLAPVAFSESEMTLPKVTGLDVFQGKPELLRTATAQMVQTIQVLERETKQEIQSLAYHPPDVLHVYFEELAVPFVIDPLELSGPKLTKIASRIRSILALDEVHEPAVQAVDLRYKDMAVIEKNGS